MKKMMKALVAVPVLVGLAAVPAIAEERLSLSGEMRVRGWTVDDDEGIGGRDESYVDQRLRMMGKIKAAEGVYAVFRLDATEARWGRYAGFGSGRLPADGSSMQWDRAYLDLTKGMFNMQAGLIYAGVSPSQVVNSQDNGIQVQFKGSVPVKAFVLLDDDGYTPAVAATDTTPAVPASDGDDAFLYAVSVAPTFGEVKTEFFGAGYNGGETDEDVYAFGASVAAPLGMATLVGEINFFTGDAAEDVDAMGLQGYFGADLAITDTITIQPLIWYAMAADDDEVQYSWLGNDFDGWDPVWEVGTKLSNEQIDLGRPFDWTGAGAGLIGGTLKVFAKVSDALNLGASVGYLTVEDDNIIDADALAIAAGGSYAIMDNTSLHAQVQYLSVDGDDVDGDGFQAGVGLFVSF
ncbi:hypothetical protein [Desulfofustis glycolicus]|uniref:Porin domain-containing protein n=1 Tax=Desulfofustis glycolicus DSM 9705 TaxID=1121409 RepID=A0A1M5X682_9BACT|nr:hypothetical protein [Desulfofustis glycolicus]SHH95350.1 hypothetical protein SAMN02745124_02813 [Desulfofustis glycolicus DSM 9705]